MALMPVTEKHDRHRSPACGSVGEVALVVVPMSVGGFEVLHHHGLVRPGEDDVGDVHDYAGRNFVT